MKKHVWKVAEIKYGSVKLVLIFLLFARCDYVIGFLILKYIYLNRLLVIDFFQQHLFLLILFANLSK